MCSISAALQGIGVVASYNTQRAQFQADAEQRRAAAASVRESAIRQYAQVGNRLVQEGEAAAAESEGVIRDAASGAAAAGVAAFESGVRGYSVRRMLEEFRGRAGTVNARIDQQAGWNEDAAYEDMRGIQAQAQDRINGLPVPTRPSMLNAALRIGAIAADAYSDRFEQNNPRQ